MPARQGFSAGGKGTHIKKVKTAGNEDYFSYSCCFFRTKKNMLAFVCFMWYKISKEIYLRNLFPIQIIQNGLKGKSKRQKEEET